MKKLRNLLFFFVFGCIQLIHHSATAQCNWNQSWFEGFEYTTVIPGVQPGVAFQNSPANWSAHSGNTSMYLNFVNTLPVGSLVYQRSVPVCATVPTRVTLWFTTTFAGGQCDVRVEILDGVGTVLSNTASILCPYSPTWFQYVSPTLTPSTPTITINLYTNTSGSPGGVDLSADDFSVEQCIASDTVRINYGNICANEPPLSLFNLLTSNPPNTGTWSGPDALTGGYLGNFNPATNAGGTYTYNTFLSNCANDTDYLVTINITQPPVLSVSHTNATSGNNGTASVTASGNGPFVYAWIPGGSNNDTLTGLGPGTYTVTVTDAFGCSASSPVNVGSGNACSWHNLISDGYEYQTSCPDIIPGTTYQTVPANWAVHSGTYSLYMNFVDSNSVNGTHAGDLVYERTINTCPNLPVQISTWLTTSFAGIQSNVRIQIVDGNNVVLADTPAIDAPHFPIWYQYQSPSITPTTNTIIFRMYTNKGGGAGNDLSMDDMLIEHCYEDLRTVKINYGNICANAASLDLYPLLTDTPAVNGLWTGPSLLTGGYLGTFNPVSNTSGSYVYTSAPYGNDLVCPLGKDTVLLSVTQLPNVNLLKTDAHCGNADGTAWVDSNTVGTAVPYQYAWSNGTATAFNGGLLPGNYFVTVTDVNLCFDTASVNILNINGIIQAVITGTDVLCFGGHDGSAAVSVTGTGYSFLWNTNPPQSDSSVTGLATGNYSVVVSSGGNCDTTLSVLISEPDSLQLDIDSTNASCDVGGSASVSVSGGTEPYNYQWSDGTQFSSIVNVPAGNYSVTVVDSNGCSLSENTTIENEPCEELSVFIPGSFTPNGDNRNDYFTIVGINFLDFSMRIFDRWGAEVFVTNDINIPWTGANKNNTALSMGVYVYHVLVNDFENTPHEYYGAVRLIR